MSKFNMIAGIRYRDPVGGWHTIGKVGALVVEGYAQQASVYLHCIYLGRCYGFPFDGQPFPFIHGDLMAHDGHYEEEGVKKSRWVRCGFISTHEADGSDYDGHENYGKQVYRINLDACPIKANKKGTALVMAVKQC